MQSPFPGMDPYLENPNLWPDVHLELISTMRSLLNKVIRPKYMTRVEERVFMDLDDDPGFATIIPDIRVEHSTSQSSTGDKPSGGLQIAEPVIVLGRDPVRQARVEIVELSSGKTVTVIEILSPSNKRKGGAGRKSFLEKRREVLRSKANWVEIDLLRSGVPHPVKTRNSTDGYFVLSSPVRIRPNAKCWPIRLEDKLPVVGIPLLHPDPDAALDLQQAIISTYDRVGYDAVIDYTHPPSPPLSSAQSKWAHKILKQSRAHG